jgi:hypothetical protein
MMFLRYSSYLEASGELLAENHVSKSSLESKMSGRMKLRRLQSSCRLFWRGVPVNSSLNDVLSARTTCESIDSSFLILWASSIIRYFQRILRRYLRHIRAPSKLVTTTSNFPLQMYSSRMGCLSSFVAINLTTRQEGSHFSN